MTRESSQVEIGKQARDGTELPASTVSEQSQQLHGLLRAAPTLFDDEMQGFVQVREWMTQWTVSVF